MHCVLVIDDSHDQLELIREQLGPQMRTIGATDGLDGYRLACAERPAVVVLDLAMPFVDGWTVLRKLRSNPATSNIPVVIVSGLEPEAIASEAERLGVRFLLRKPYDVDELRKTIRTALNAATTR
ncbi:MAG TPA: response regulator [Vicinamibacterales bacterium]|nr:response regulator [Vicinamibacterales bacterium]